MRNKLDAYYQHYEVKTHDIPSNSVAVGNPARVICTLEKYIAKERNKMCPENSFTGLYYEGEPDRCRTAVAAAEKYGEIFVN